MKIIFLQFVFSTITTSKPVRIQIKCFVSSKEILELEAWWVLRCFCICTISGKCKDARGTIKVEELRFTAVLCTSVTWRFKWHLKQFKTLLYFIKHAKLIFAASGHGQPWQPNFTECISGISLDIHVYRKYNHSPFFFNWF